MESYDIEMNKEAFNRLINLNEHRRYVTSMALKKNSMTMSQMQDIFNKTHLTHINLALEMYRPRLLALNKLRLARYLDTTYPTISLRGLQNEIRKELKNHLNIMNLHCYWMYRDEDIKDKCNEIDKTLRKSDHAVFKVYSYT